MYVSHCFFAVQSYIFSSYHSLVVIAKKINIILNWLISLFFFLCSYKPYGGDNWTKPERWCQAFHFISHIFSIREVFSSCS